MRQYKTYKHYKGGLYIKICEALHTETDEITVIYACAIRGEVFCRPKSSFEEIVTKGTYQGPRFKPLPDGLNKEDAIEFTALLKDA